MTADPALANLHPTVAVDPATIWLNDSTWNKQHVDGTAGYTKCGLSTHSSGFVPLPSRTIVSNKPICAICLRAVWTVHMVRAGGQALPGFSD